MALSSKSLFLYGYQVTENNRSIDFKGAVTDTSPRQATLKLGFYSATSLGAEIKRAMQQVDALRIYTVTVDRTIAGGTQNRLTISSNGAFFQLLFLTGPRTASTVAPLIGFTIADHTGFTTYTGTMTTGTIIVPTLVGYNYLSPDFFHKITGNVNVSASGKKESIVFNIQKFTQVEFNYEPKNRITTEWMPFLDWAIRHKPFEFTPEISFPNVVYQVTMDKTDEDGKALGYRMKEMLPQFPNLYRTGMLVMRQVQ